MKYVVTILSLILLTLSSPIFATTYDHQVDARENLYNADWIGNPFSDVWDDGFWYPYDNDSALNTPGAINARAVKDGSGHAVDFSNGLLSIIAKGEVKAFGDKFTGPGGDVDEDWLFRDLTVYSLIGLWSSTANSITAMGSAFFIGTGGNFVAPLDTAYLFLAENDGIFEDNSGHYDVTIDFTNIAVPIPASIWLIVSGFICFLGFRSRNNKSIQ